MRRASRFTLALMAALLVGSLQPSAFAEDSLESQLKKAVVTKDMQKALELLSKMQAIGGTDRMTAVLQCVVAVPQDEEILYWLLVRGATGFVDRPALRCLGEFIVKKNSDAVARDLMFGLQGNRARPVIEAHAMVLKDGASDLARMAAEELASIPEETSVEALIIGMKAQQSSGVRVAIGRSLAILTDQTFGEDHELWLAWFEGGKEAGLERDAEGRIRRKGDDAYRTIEREVLKESGKVLVLTATCKAQENAAIVFDNIENILSLGDIPHDVYDKVDFNRDLPKLDQYFAIVINCTQFRPHCECPTCKLGDTDAGFRMRPCVGCNKHITGFHRLEKDGVEHIRKFVENGGYLFTEDWGLIEVLEPAWNKIVGYWPKFVDDPITGQILGIEDFLDEQDVDVNPVRGETTNPLMRSVYSFHRPATHGVGSGDPVDAEGDGETEVVYNAPLESLDDLSHMWHIDDESPSIEIRNKSAVKVLLRSQALRGIAEGNDACAITFFPGKNGTGKKAPVITDGDGSDSMPGAGRVLHILSHFGKQADVADEVAIRNLLFNFLREGAVCYNRMHPPQKRVPGNGASER